ncbi:MAG TPA: hypothetical protein VLY65_01505 [Nitrososphaerales archaeon]|nr:hypothetical protein [Nitrososphaerales archaeon]
MSKGQSAYVAAFLESSLGLLRSSVRPEDIPKDLLESISSAMRGSPPRDTESPSLETLIMRFLREHERESLEEHGFSVRKARWPDAASFAVCLTHDVDNIEHPLDHITKTKDRFSRADLAKATKGLLSLYDNIELIGEKEGEEGFRSSFYFLSAHYPLEKVRPSALKLLSKGWEIGLHGDFGTHDSLPEMMKAVDRLEKGIGVHPTGLREHYLKFDFAKSWRVFESAGFQYDTTVGNNDALGFKLGLATPFHPPDEDWRPMKLLELPLSLMDTTLWGYLKRTEEEGLEDVARSMGMVESVEGLFTLLWHQEAVRMKGGRAYWKVLKALGRRKDVFVGSGRQVADWWRAREVPLKPSGDGMTVTLGGRLPKGLALVVKTRGGVKAKVTSGRLEKRGAHTLVHPSGAGFRLTFRGGAQGE